MRCARRLGEPRMSMTTAIPVIAAAAVLASCDAPERAHWLHAVKFVVESDPGVPLARTQILVDGEPVGHSDAQGILWATVRGAIGEQLRIKHDCPAGYVAPPEPKFLRLWRVAGIGTSDATAVEVTLSCKPEDRLAVFVVRTKNGHDLPVTLNGVQIARTNRLGVTHFSTRGTPGTEFVVELDTRERPRVLPSRPTHLFSLQEADEIFVLNQSFDVRDVPRRRRPRRNRIIKIE